MDFFFWQRLLFWGAVFIVSFILLFVVVVFIINKIAQKEEQANLQKTFVENNDFYEQIKEIIRLLSNNDSRVVQEIEMLNLETKITFAKKYLSDLNMETKEDYSGWDLMIFTLEKAGYLSYNDWKFSLGDLVSNLTKNLEKLTIDPEIFENYSNLEKAIDPSEFSVLARYLPEGYALANIDTGGDAYAVTVAPIENFRKAVEISALMEKPCGVNGIEMYR